MIQERRMMGDVEVFSLAGSLDVSVSEKVGQELRTSIQAGHTKLVLDLERLRLVDSSGLSVLVSVLKAARREGGDVVLARLPAPVRPVMELTRLDRVFTIAESEQEALDAVRKGPV